MQFPKIYLAAAGVPLLFAALCAADYLRHEREYGLEDRKETPYVPSAECRSCHEDHYRSWRATFHSRMTAPATAQNVKAPIGEGVSMEFCGWRVEFRRDGGSYSVDLPWHDGKYRRFPLLYTIGSRRMQQFAVRDGDKIYRIPVFYSIEHGRWMHINEAFFRRREEGLKAFTEGYSVWNPNCIFCHNTRPNPGYDFSKRTFDSRVAETGIACEECHAPGKIHASLNRNPLRRLLHAGREGADSSVTNASRLDKAASVQVCGQCHGQRLPEPLERIESLMASGDPFAAGENLFQYYKPIRMGDELPSYRNFHLRFWKDGSPRLTAYELQGLTQSACFMKSERMDCQSCHNMHGGDPMGMINPEMRTNRACTQCHAEYESRAGAERHGGHRLESASCYDCHMPDAVYGVMTVHPTHHIRSPGPRRTVEFGMPDACTNCHLDKSVDWAIEGYNRLWKKNLPPAGGDFSRPEILRGLAQGDVVYRVVLLDQARKRNLEGFEALYGRVLDDAFYLPGFFAALALEKRFQTAFSSPREWKPFLSARSVREWKEFETLRRDNDVAFEFGE
jgi:predicted CXXCH cytochrome family protein